MKRKLILLFAFAGVLSSLEAQVIDLTTGTDPIGNSDPIWTVRQPGSGVFGPATIVNTHQSYADDECGRWITPWATEENNISSAPGTAGTFTYRMQFSNNSCITAGSLDLDFMAADNEILALRVNGTSYTVPTGINFNNPGSMSTTVTLVYGTNTVDVDVDNWQTFTALMLCGDITLGDAPVTPVPTNLGCCSASGGQMLSWDAVSGATSYIVDIIWDDPECCSGDELFPSQNAFPTTETVYMVPSYNSCFSWSVAAVLSGGCTGNYSERICSCGTDIGGLGGSDKTGKENTGAVQNPESLTEVLVSVNPNPADHLVNFEVKGFADDLAPSGLAIVLFNLSGQEVKRVSIKAAQPNPVDVSTLTPGVYLYQLVDSNKNQLIKADKLVIE